MILLDDVIRSCLPTNHFSSLYTRYLVVADDTTLSVPVPKYLNRFVVNIVVFQIILVDCNLDSPAGRL
jgi:hypothetical protein